MPGRFVWQRGDVVITHRSREAVGRLREYSDDEPRDYHGRWSGGGDGAVSASEHTSPTVGPFGKTDPVWQGQSWSSQEVRSEFTTEDRQGVQQALHDALAKYPELENSSVGRPYLGIAYLSSGIAPGPDNGYDQAVYNGLVGQMRDSGADGITGGATAGGPMMTVLDDTQPKANDPPGWSFDTSTYGLASHEIGHAWADANGIVSDADGARVLAAAGLKPNDLAPYSRYGTSGAQEAIAELFSANMRGGVPPGLASQWDALSGLVEANGRAGGGSAARIPASAPAAAAVRTAAAINTKANDWVTSWRDQFAKVREAYNPDEPRDDHGRWTGGGDSGSSVIDAAKAGGGTINPTTGEQPSSGFAVAIEGHSSITPDSQFFSGPKGQEAGRQITRDWLRQNAAVFDNPAMHIGVWHDTGHHEIVLDPSEVVPEGERDRAVALGVERNQQAIYDIGQGAEIPTGGTGDR